MKAYCPWCKRDIQCVTPKGGGGEAYVYVRHGKPRCDGSRMIVELKHERPNPTTSEGAEK